MDLLRIATRVAAQFTASEPEAMGGLHEVVKGLRAAVSGASQVVDLAAGTELEGPDLDAVNKAVEGFTGKWGPQVRALQAETTLLARTVGDSAVRARRGRTRG